MIKRTLPYAGMLHEVVEHNRTLYLAGIVSEDLGLDMKGQAEDCMRQMKSLLSAHGSSMSRVLQATIYMSDLAQKAAFDAVWKASFAEGEWPARAGIGAGTLGKDVLVEIVVIAAKA